jgi:two-component system response regulator RegA
MRKRVLVVDDDILIQKVSRTGLQRAGFEAVVAGSAAEVLAWVAVARFDTAILDYFLGDRECGCDLIAPLRARNRSIRIVVLSGLGGLAEIVRHAHDAGADVVASKGHVDWNALGRGESSHPPPAPPPPTVDLAALKRDVIHGTYQVHHRNVSATARALGLTRSSLQRALRKTPPPGLSRLGRPGKEESE